VIRINRPAAVPAKLQTDGVSARAALEDTFDSSPDEYRSGVKKLQIKSSIYGHKSVKQALLGASGMKCWFCEALVSHVAHGDVEHFRPKAGFQQKKSDPLSKPGYYWLAYEWANLLFACQICNQIGKKNVFPLQNINQRATSHHDDHTQEKPLLIDPAVDDPEKFIGFREEVAFPKQNLKRAKTTIEVLGLNREPMLEARRQVLAPYKLLVDLLRMANSEIEALQTAGQPIPADLQSMRERLASQIEVGRQPAHGFSSMLKAATTDL
jgi:uncharacterized protein (TIGR02646 family)